MRYYYNMKATRLSRLPAAVLALSLLAGCGGGRGVYSNYRRLEELQLVETLGVDAGEDGGVLLSASAGTGAAGDGAVLSARAGALIPCMEALQNRTVRGQVFFAHTQFLVLGQAYAENGVAELLDYVERDIHTRMGTGLFVARDAAASALVTGAGSDWDVSGVLASVRRETAGRGDSHVYDLRETAVALSEYGAALVCALRIVGTEGGVYAASPGLSAVPAGYGVLKDGRLVGFLEEEEAYAASLLCGTLGAQTRLLPDGSGGAVTVELRCPRPEMRCRRAPDGALTLEIAAKPEAVIAAAGSADVVSGRAPEALAAALDAAVREDLFRVVRRAQALDADFLAFGRALRLDGVDPARLPPDWLRTLSVRVTVDTTLARSYDMGAPASLDGGG